MSWIAAAIIGSSLIGAAGASSAADTQAAGAQQAAATQQQMFNTINQQEQPFIQGGYAANTRLRDLLGIGDNKGAAGYGSLTSNFTPADFLANKDPGYDFQLQQGGQALRNADTPGIGALSGAALKDLIGFNQGMASTGYQNAFNRWNTQQGNVFARLSGLAGLGQNAASNVGTSGTALGTGIGQAQAAAGAAQAGGIVGMTNALSGGASSLAGMMYMGQNTGNPLMSQGFYGNNSSGYTHVDPASVGPMPGG